MTSISSLLPIFLTIISLDNVNPRSDFTVSRGISDIVVLETSSGYRKVNCSAIDAHSASPGKGCRCNLGGTYYTSNAGKTKCFQDLGQSVGMF